MLCAVTARSTYAGVFGLREFGFCVLLSKRHQCARAVSIRVVFATGSVVEVRLSRTDPVEEIIAYVPSPGGRDVDEGDRSGWIKEDRVRVYMRVATEGASDVVCQRLPNN